MVSDEGTVRVVASATPVQRSFFHVSDACKRAVEKGHWQYWER